MAKRKNRYGLSVSFSIETIARLHEEIKKNPDHTVSDYIEQVLKTYWDGTCTIKTEEAEE